MGPSACASDGSFGPTVEGCRGDFDFTLKFENIVLSILPSAVFITLSIPRVILLARRPSIVGGAFLQSVKVTAAVILSILWLVLLVLSCIESLTLPILSTTANSLDFIASISISLLAILEHSRSLRPSILLSAFLSLTILFEIARVRSLWLLAHTHFELIFVRLFTAAIVLKAFLLLLESLHHQRRSQCDRKAHSPEETSGLYGLGTFLWLLPLVMSGYKKTLDLSDLFPLERRVAVENLQKTFAKYAQRSSFHGDQNGLAKAVVRTLAIPFLLPVAPRLALVGFTLCQSFLIETILKWLTDPDTDLTIKKGYGLIGATGLVYAGMPIVTALYWYLHERALFMLRACLVSAIYERTTQKQISAQDDKAAVTLMSTDVERVQMGLMQLHEFWANPLQVAIVSWLLQRQIGTAFVAPLIVVVLCAIASSFVMRFVGPKQMAWMQAIQKRVGHTSTVIGTMKHLRIAGLTQPVEGSIQRLRKDELNAGDKFRTFLVTSVGIGFTPLLLGPVFAFAFTFGNLDPTTIFTSLAYLQLLSGPFSTLFQVAPQLRSAFACLYDFRQLVLPSLVKITAGGFGWQTDALTLKNINISISAGLNMAFGPVACGKSTLCKALLGETPIVCGEVFVRTKFRQVGYCEQIPFLPNASIRDIIQGIDAFDAERYASIIDATMLSRDLQLLPQGDQTQIGSEGLALSGGQKRRIALARALYLQCDLLILDDVLSGLDTATEEHIFRAVFGPSGILKARGAIVILCTTAIRHLPAADFIIALGKDGTIVERGLYNELVANRHALRGLDSQAAASEISPPPSTSTVSSPPTLQSPTAGQKALSTKLKVNESSRTMGDTTVFAYYCRSIGPVLLVSFAAFGMFCGFLFNFPTIWVSYWSTDAFSQSKSFYMGIYALLQCLALTSVLSEAAIGMLTIIRTAGSRLHDAALRTVISTPWSTLSQTDTGIITNLFSQDLNLIDGELAQALINTSLQLWIAIGGAAVIAISSPYIIAAYPFILALLYAIQRFYLRTSRQLRLLDLEAKSPLYTHHLNTINGAATLRAFDWIKHSISVNNTLLNTSQRPAYLLNMIQRWLSFVLDIVVAVLSVLIVTLTTQLRTSPGFTGASLVSLMSFGKTLAGLVRMYTVLETSIGAVARIKAFGDETGPREENRPLGEADDSVGLHATWPDRGRITVQHVSALYSGESMSATVDNSQDLALRDLTFSVEAGQKVAICGRTGSGKSSVILLLLRLLDPVQSSSNTNRNTILTIDGIPLQTIDHSTLRRRLIAVPQDATFFPAGTSFRTNLDPFSEATDAECQAVLERTGLWTLVTARGGLSAALTPDTLSHGQKQLWSLARAVLRRRLRDGAREQQIVDNLASAKSRSVSVSIDSPRVPTGGVLLLDEVDSGVDVETQRMMHDLIWSEFEGYTVVMVGHRLDMVEEFDKVLVMDAGRLVEEGSPRELIDIPGGWLRGLWMVGRG
ncbi:ABC transporter [Aspergillus heteromorphus CBS 117.55]|uniref:ABC transporter n=1 Tax=Aspergillus heteromorphus CBS 117.55 TaxID=1448321 RepID=A0A317VSZ9_9EURO|nr:ABC transporter [Aspergillus heteromorphus CBS 117.55]PWY75050.1 ABC transporter [Aspergillus heteromorphus CBS 117.55]